MHTLNLGILAHVDAGKTSLTERLLYAAGVLPELGSVDAGSTQTDTLALERRRGITIKAAAVSFALGDGTVNLVDTPGHPDFIAEVERVLGVLDGAVLVLSAVEGVQPQTRILMRALQRMRLPTLLFVNKIDRRGAQEQPLLRAIAERLTPAVLPMGAVRGLGTAEARFTAYRQGDAGHRRRLVDVLTAADEALLAACVEDEAAVPDARLAEALAAQTRQALVHPVYFGSAITGAGVAALTEVLPALLPSSDGDPEGPLSGSVFQVERGRAGAKLAWVRMRSGTLHVRDRVPLHGEHPRVTALSVLDRGHAVPRSSVAAGRIAQVWGLAPVQVGDALGAAPAGADERHFAPPTLETLVVPVRSGDRGRLHVALTQLAEQDPLIGLRQDDRRGELSVSLYGEVQKEVLQATLSEEYGVQVTFRESTALCIERPVGTGSALEVIDVAPNPFLATVGLRVDPGAAGSGVRFALGIELGSLPLAFIKAVEETVMTTLQQGLHGWAVTDCAVTLTQSGYWPRQSHAHGTFDKSMSSTAGDFRGLTPLVLMTALRGAGTQVLEPVHRFALDLPAGSYGSVLPVLTQLGAVPRPAVARGAAYLLEGTIPAAQVHRLRQRLPGLTSGEGVMESEFDSYRPVQGAPPTRPRFDVDPLDRKAYLLQVVRRVSGGPAGG